jgi:rhodanese-related sulfurtransferase
MSEQPPLAATSAKRRAPYGIPPIRSVLAVELVPSVINIPLPLLRSRLNELPRDREIWVICRPAQRAYNATRILLQNGFNVRILSGGRLSRTNLP